MANYISTRNSNITKTTYETILDGISKDGGLYVMEKINKIEDIYVLKDLNYRDLAFEIMRSIFDDVEKEELKKCIGDAYGDNFDDKDIVPLVKKKDDYFLELFHGPTSAFKDIALTFLPRIMSLANKKIGGNRKIAVLTATSGDTGKAALEGFKDVEGTMIKVMYPSGMVSTIQEKQMVTSSGKNVEVLAVKGNFDDCQKLLKKVLTRNEDLDVFLTSANSINIGRLVPQIVYYFKAYLELLRKNEIEKGEKIDFVVPTGNFGNILAGYIAKQMGLPIDKLICSSNKNNVLTDFINTGVYDADRILYNTMAPSIDILISSNLERLLYFVSKDTNKVKEYMDELNSKKTFKVDETILNEIRESFVGLCASEEETSKAIKEYYKENHYLIDTHTAVAFACGKKYTSNNKRVVLATASPFKFSKDVYYCLTGKEIDDDLSAMEILANNCNLAIPKNLEELKHKEVRFKQVIDKNDDQIIIRKLKDINV